MNEPDLLTDSNDFWNRHQPEMNRARARAMTGEVCEFCGGNEQHLVKSAMGVVYLCACTIVEREKEQAGIYRSLSHVTPEDTALTFETIMKRKDPKWPKMQAAIDGLQQMTIAPRNSQWARIAGAPGIGKTHMLMAAYNKMSHVAVYVLAGKLADQIHDGLKREGPRPEDWQGLTDLKRNLIDVPVLLLDDLGQEHDSPFVNAMFTDILVQRYQSGRSRPTVVATNLRPAETNSRYQRIESRLRDADLVVQHIIGLSDYRELKGSNGKS